MSLSSKPVQRDVGLANDWWLKLAVTIPGNLDQQFAKITVQGFPTLAVAGIAGGMGDRFMPGMTQVFGHFSFQCAFNQRLG